MAYVESASLGLGSFVQRRTGLPSVGRVVRIVPSKPQDVSERKYHIVYDDGDEAIYAESEVYNALIPRQGRSEKTPAITDTQMPSLTTSRSTNTRKSPTGNTTTSHFSTTTGRGYALLQEVHSKFDSPQLDCASNICPIRFDSCQVSGHLESYSGGNVYSAAPTPTLRSTGSSRGHSKTFPAQWHADRTCVALVASLLAFFAITLAYHLCCNPQILDVLFTEMHAASAKEAFYATTHSSLENTHAMTLDMILEKFFDMGPLFVGLTFGMCWMIVRHAWCVCCHFCCACSDSVDYFYARLCHPSPWSMCGCASPYWYWRWW
jgi:hypothetical protein